MQLPFYIARRYILSKKSHNIINIISAISVVGVAVGTMALIVVLSVFNGFEDLVKSLYSAFDPDFKITAVKGKTFEKDSVPRDEILNIPGVVSYTEVVEENALLKFKSEQTIVSLKGVSDDFLSNNPLSGMLYDGEFRLKGDAGEDYVIMGYLVAYNLGVRLFDYENPIVAYVPRRTAGSLATIDRSFNSGALVASAVYAVQQEIDSKYVIVSIDFARKLLEYSPGQVTSVEVRLAKGVSFSDVQGRIGEVAGKGFEVKNRFQQQALLYRIMKSEKWAIFFILTFILIIAAFNVTGSLSMLVIDKRKDIAILHSMGASNKLIKRIFLAEGLLVSLSGAIAGLVIGFILCFIQIKFGLIRLGDANAFVVPYYPVKMMAGDFIAVFLTVFLIGLVSSWYPVRQISKKYLQQRIAEFTKSQ